MIDPGFRRPPFETAVYASVPTDGGRAGRLRVHQSEAVMITEIRWTPLSLAPCGAFASWLAAWRRRKGVDEQQCKAALHQWENEGGTREIPP